nr:MAG TPA: hypothetical protein [Siphoviridae sp. ctvS314]
MTSTPKYGQAEALVRASVGQWLTKASKAAMDDTKPSLLEHMGPGGKLHAYVGGLDVGTVSVTDPKPREVLKIIDEAAFTAWVKANHPDVIVETVAPWFSATANLTALIAHTGEMPDGVEITERVGSPTVQVRLSEGQIANLEGLAAGSAIAAYITTGEPEEATK